MPSKRYLENQRKHSGGHKIAYQNQTTLNLAEAGYLLLVTSYWLLIRLLVTDSVYCY